MRKLSLDAIKMLEENPEAILPAEFASYETLERQIQKFHCEKYTKELMAQLAHYWKITRSYGYIVEESDIMKMIDKVYKEYDNQNT